MSSAVALRATFLLALVGCGFSDLSNGVIDAGEPEPPPAPPAPPPVDDPEPPPLPPEPDGGLVVPGPPPQLKLSRTPQLDGFLTDGEGQPLYMYVNDIANSKLTACLQNCAQTWTPYDADPTRVGPGIEPSEVARFHRQDGDWQLTYKGFPLYRRTDEAGATSPTADGTNGRWFVARDYLAFLAPPKNFEPAGGSAADVPYLTDGFGRTLYVNLDDVPAADGEPPETTCTGACVSTRTPMFARATVRTTALPSRLLGTDLSAFVRPEGALQLTYRGWPLYYFAGDRVAGETAGHNEASWRAIDPVAFEAGIEAQRVLPE